MAVMGGWISWRTRYAGTCASSGLPFAAQQRVVFYPLTKQMHVCIAVLPCHAALLTPKGDEPAYCYVLARYHRWVSQSGDSEAPQSTNEVSAVTAALANAFVLCLERNRGVYLHEYDLEASWH